MDRSREMLSRLSTSTDGDVTVPTPHRGNCMELLHNLYQKLEPQMTKSYRPNVKYVPTPASEMKHYSHVDRTASDKIRKGKHLKATQIVISAVSEMQKRRDSTVTQNSAKKKFGDLARRMSDKGLAELDKEASQSLPNLANAES